MSNKKAPIVHILRETADRLDQGARYEWGHMGRCNCGHLVQTLTDLSDREIARAVDYRLDEWTEYAKDYCPDTGSPLEDLFQALAEVGFTPHDIMRLERLSDPRVVAALGPKGQRLRRNSPPDVSLYMRTLADVIAKEEQSSHLTASVSV